MPKVTVQTLLACTRLSVDLARRQAAGGRRGDAPAVDDESPDVGQRR
jgi:hypothetical protein